MNGAAMDPRSVLLERSVDGGTTWNLLEVDDTSLLGNMARRGSLPRAPHHWDDGAGNLYRRPSQ